MLELHILKYLMRLERTSQHEQGRLLGWSLSHFRELNHVPKGTFYRAVNVLIDEGFLLKQRRGFYIVSDDFRRDCNDMKRAERIRSL